MTKNSTTQAWSCARISREASKSSIVVSPSTVYRILKDNNYSSYKQTVKPGLTLDMKKARYDWCKAHEHWEMEDWKNVIWTDETSVQMGGIRGKRRVWRTPEESHHPHVIKRRWKSFKEFMFWGCFSYDKQGPCFI